MAEGLLHLIFSGIFTFTAGFLVDREMKRRQQAEREQYLVSIGQIATTIVHDLKNPLITILGFDPPVPLDEFFQLLSRCLPSKSYDAPEITK
jgi:signal transduction histidine kinase